MKFPSLLVALVLAAGCGDATVGRSSVSSGHDALQVRGATVVARGPNGVLGVVLWGLAAGGGIDGYRLVIGERDEFALALDVDALDTIHPNPSGVVGLAWSGTSKSSNVVRVGWDGQLTNLGAVAEGTNEVAVSDDLTYIARLRYSVPKEFSDTILEVSAVGSDRWVRLGSAMYPSWGSIVFDGHQLLVAESRLPDCAVERWDLDAGGDAECVVVASRLARFEYQQLAVLAECDGQVVLAMSSPQFAQEFTLATVVAGKVTDSRDIPGMNPTYSCEFGGASVYAPGVTGEIHLFI